MSKKRNKITIFIVAAMMFTSTWAGVFATDPDQPADTDQAVTGQGVDGQDVTVGVDGTETPAPADATKNSEVNAEGEDDTESNDVAVEAPDVKISGKTITVTWKPVTSETGSVTYTLTEKANDNEPVLYEGIEDTQWVGTKEPGLYSYSITSYVDGVEYSTSDFSDYQTVKPNKLTKPDKTRTPVVAGNDIVALSGKGQIWLRWKTPVDVDRYIICRFDSAAKFDNSYKVGDKEAGARVIDDPSGYLTYDDANNTVTWRNEKSIGIESEYWYKVYAVKDVKDENGNSVAIMSDAAVVKKKGCVRPMYITLKLKKKRTLKSLNGGPRITLKKNEGIKASGFGGGCYYFWRGKYQYRMARSSAKKQVAHYNGRNGYNYTPEEAELFVNQAKLTSPKQYLIWVSFYTQHVYIMKKTSAGKWEYDRGWECATGKASTPSPTGNKAIGKKKKKHHNIKWWSSFSSPKKIANSIHGKKKGWKLGLPQSHGCIRNDVANAKWIYDHCQKYTKVYNY